MKKLNYKHMILITTVFLIISVVTVILYFKFKDTNNYLMNIVNDVSITDVMLNKHGDEFEKAQFYHRLAITMKYTSYGFGILSAISLFLSINKCLKNKQSNN